MGVQPDLVAADAEVDELEAKRQRKAAKRAAKEAAAAAEAEAEEADEEEVKRQRKNAKKRAREAAAWAATAEEKPATAEEPAAETPKKSKKEKRVAEAEVAVEAEDAPKAKKSKQVEAVAEDTKEGSSDKVNNALKVFIKGLPYTADQATARKDFAECGEIIAFKMPMNDQGAAKGFAFIQFATQEGFDAALKLDNTDYGGRYLNVSKVEERDAAGKGKTIAGDWTCPSCSELVFASKSNCRKCGSAKPGANEDNVNTVFIRGLPWAVTEETLRKEFSACGEIEKLSLPKNEEGKPKGISFIKYKSQEAVDAALKFDNTDFGGRTIFVSEAGAAPKGKDGKDKGKGKGKGKDGKGKDGKGKDGKDGKGKDGKDGKGKSKGKGKDFVPTAAFANKMGCIVEGTGEKKTFADSDDE